jgi:hypothetical protein
MMGTPVVEYWRSRLLPRQVVYWRRADSEYLVPDCGSPSDAARMLQYVRAQYGRPVAREVVRTRYGKLTRLTFAKTRKVFRTQPVRAIVTG